MRLILPSLRITKDPDTLAAALRHHAERTRYTASTLTTLTDPDAWDGRPYAITSVAQDGRETVITLERPPWDGRTRITSVSQDGRETVGPSDA